MDAKQDSLGKTSNHMGPFVLEPGAGISVRNPVGGRLVFKLRGERSTVRGKPSPRCDC